MKGFCRFCQGMRSANAGRQCDGCGMPIANAFLSDSSRKKSKLRLKCPQCRSTNADEVEKDPFLCNTCGSVFEAVDQSFVDTRPEQNAMKKERAR